MLEGLFRNVTEGEKKDAIEAIVQHASPRHDFFLMLVLSISMAVYGVLLESTVILIGSMLIAPLLYPLLSLALGIITSDAALMGRSFYTLVKSAGVALLAGFAIAFLFAGDGSGFVFPLGIVAGGSQSLMYAVVAVIAGFAAAFAVTKPHLNETMPGVAISVALVPPLAAAGVGLSFLNWEVTSNALLLFLVNVIGIVFSAMVVFALFRFGVKKTVTQEAFKEDEKLLKQEKADASS
jgi:uncharacterized hydrophobic protein (TIGR00271 family)